MVAWCCFIILTIFLLLYVNYLTARRLYFEKLIIKVLLKFNMKTQLVMIIEMYAFLSKQIL